MPFFWRCSRPKRKHREETMSEQGWGERGRRLEGRDERVLLGREKRMGKGTNGRQQLSIKYYLQYQMATKDGKRMEIMALRSSRRMKGIEIRQEKTLVAENEAEQPDEHDLHNQMEEHKEQQITPKNEKETALPSNNQPQSLHISDDTARRLTRSSALLPKRIISQPELPIEPVTPEDNPVRMEQEQPTCKKMVRVGSCAWLSEGGSPQLLGTARKGVSRVQSIISPYSEVRKSYRKIHKKEIVSIPYRKCHDAFEGRIVTIINKIEGGKNCIRDFQSLIDKIQRITPKDMTNRHIIAGIDTIVRLTSHPHHDPLLTRLHHEHSTLKSKIEEELQRTDDFQHCLLQKNQQLIDSREYKKMTVRRIFKLMKMRRGCHNLKQIRERALNDCEKHFNNEVSVSTLVRFIRQKMEIAQE